MAKTVLIPQTTFTATNINTGLNRYRISNLLINADKITVVFDNTNYKNIPASTSDIGDSYAVYKYGAPEDGESGYDFSEYPFGIRSATGSKGPVTNIDVPDANQHTIEVYTGEDEEGGGSMPSSEITGKTFEEMLAASTQLDLSAKFKDYIYEFSNDVHAMGEVVYFHEEGSAKILFKDAEFKKPVTDYELLAMYLSEVVPVQLTDENKALQRFELLASEKLHFLEYKDSSVTKRFYQIGDYFSGEAYKDLMGFVPGDAPKSAYAVVGTAVVGTDVVAPSENPAA